jgi:hypothetical protein
MLDVKSWALGVCVLSAAITARAQITDNPLPAPIVKRGLAVEVRDVVRLPETRQLRPVEQDVTPTGWARVSFVRDAPDGRRFANDSRGFLYIVEGARTRLYADVAAVFPHAWYARLESGFIGFDFHPEFERNGLGYSVHLERVQGNPAPPDFIPPGYGPGDVTFHNVITEWRAHDPRASTFTGPRRELLRVAHDLAGEPAALADVGFVRSERRRGEAGRRDHQEADSCDAQARSSCVCSRSAPEGTRTPPLSAGGGRRWSPIPSLRC